MAEAGGRGGAFLAFSCGAPLFGRYIRVGGELGGGGLGGGEVGGPVARAATEAATAAAGSAAADSAAADSVAARAVARAATKAAGEEGEDCQQTRPLARPRKGTQRSHSTPPSRDDDGVE